MFVLSMVSDMNGFFLLDSLRLANLPGESGRNTTCTYCVVLISHQTCFAGILFSSPGRPLVRVHKCLPFFVSSPACHSSMALCRDS